MNYTDFSWVETFGGAKSDYSTDAQTDPFGNLIIIGVIYGEAQFGNQTITPIGSQDQFIAKYNPDGELIWVKRIGNEIDEDRLKSLVIDSSGNIYISGSFEYSLDLDPSENEFLITSNGMKDNFVMKLDVNGNLVWGTSFGNQNSDNISGISLDQNNNLYLTGYYKGTVDFNPGSDIFEMTSVNNTSDVYLMKMNQMGEFLWAKSFDGSNFESGGSVVVDHDNHLYLSGRAANATVDLDPGPGVFEVVSNAGSDGGNFFIVKLDLDGNFLNGGITSRSGTDPMSATVVDMVVDSENNLYISGYWYGWTDFDLGSGEEIHPSLYASQANTFVMKVNADLEFQWFNYAQNYVAVRASSLSIDQNDILYLTGYSNGGANFMGNKLPSCFCHIEAADAAYIATLNADGFWIDAYDFNTDSRVFGSMDRAGNFLMAGYYKFSLRFWKDLDEEYFYLENPDEDFEEGFLMKLGDLPLPALDNHPPVAVDDEFDVIQGASTTFNLIENDTDLENNIDPASVIILRQPQFGMLTNHNDGSFSYLHDGSETTTDGFSYVVFDNEGLVSNLAFVNLLIQPNLNNNEVELNQKIKVYPNPFTYFVLINATDHLIQSIELYDFSGRLIIQKSVNRLSEYQFDTQRISKGNYLLKINTVKGSKTIQIIKK